jgi:hypothetical protein
VPDVATLWSIIANGGGALALAIFLIAAFLRGWVVPGFIYEASQKRIERLLESGEQVAAALDRLTDEIRRDRGR